MESTLQNYSKEQLIALVEEQSEVLATQQKALAEAKAELKNVKADNHSLVQKNNSLEDQAIYLKYQIEQFRRKIFGQTRERFTHAPANLPQLPFETPEAEKKVIEQEAIEEIVVVQRRRKTTKHHGRKPLPESLPVEIVEIFPEEDYSQMECIGQEITEVLVHRPAQIYKKRYIRYKFAPKSKDKVVIGKLPDRFIPKGIAGNSLLASILIAKFIYHLPIYRQLQRFRAEGINIPASTIDGWVKQVLDAINIIYESFKKDIKSKGYLQADETTIKVQVGDKKGKCHTGYYWVYNSPMDNVVLFDYQPNRSIASAENILKDFKGYLQTDGYAGYEAIGKRTGIVHLFCWAHARREFDRALINDKERSEKALGYIQKLYRIEAEARQRGMSPQERKEFRLEYALPIINEFGKWLFALAEQRSILPKDQFGKAVLYTLKRWDGLKNYLFDGVLEIDNNLVENAIRPIAMGRKNYLFAGSHEAASRAACIYTFFAICKKHDVNAYEWLTYVLDNLSESKITDLEHLYPQNFKKNIKE